MAKFKKYENYKNTNVDFIDHIPCHWEQTQIKAIARPSIIKNKPKEELLSVYREYGVIPKHSRDDNRNVDGKDLSTYKYVKKDNLVVNKMKAWQGSMGVSDYNGIVSPAYIVCKLTDNVYPKYVHYLLRSKYFIAYYNQISYGVRIGQWDMRYNDFKNLPFFIPTINEQKQIVKFIKYKEKQINKLIQKTKKIIEMLDQKKQTVVDEAVTKGIRPNILYKDSKFDWINKIPNHWEMLPNRAIFKERNTRNCPKEELLSVTIKNGIIKQTQLLENSIKKDSSNEDKSKYKLVKVNDIAYNKMRMWQGAVGVSNFQGIVSPAYIILNPIKTINPKYFHYLYRSPKYIRYSYNYSYGICDDQLSLRYKDFSKMYSTIPPLEEQTEIATYLDKVCRNIDTLIFYKSNLIEKLIEYKKSLFAQVVIGQIDVRDYEIPETDDNIDIEEMENLSEDDTETMSEVEYANN